MMSAPASRLANGANGRSGSPAMARPTRRANMMSPTVVSVVTRPTRFDDSTSIG